MPITTNASKREHQKLTKAFIKSLGGDAKGVTANLDFTDDELEFTFNGYRYLLPVEKFSDWAEKGFPRTGSGSPALGRWKVDEASEEAPETPEEPPEEKPKARGRKGSGKKAEAAPAAPSKAKKAQPKPKSEPKPAKPKKAEPAPEPEDLGSPDIRPASFSEELNALISDAYTIEEQREAGELGANAARYKSGALVMRLDQLKERAKAEGHEEYATRKALLDLLNKGQLALADERGTLRRFKPLGETEAAMMAKVVDKFCAGDIGSSFRYVDRINPLTGEPLVGDDGEPLQVPITEVAPDKLYPFVQHVPSESSEEFHRLVSFAHTYSEKNVKAVARLADRLEKPPLEVIDEVLKWRVTTTSPVTGNEVKAQMDDDGLALWLKDKMPPSPPSPYYSITTERSWGEGIWEPLKRATSWVNEQHRFAMPNEETGDVSAILVFETTINQYFNVNEQAGWERLLSALNRAGYITEEQAVNIASNYRYDPDVDDVRELTDEEKEALQEADASESKPDDEPEDDDEPPFAADLDIDTPEDEEEHDPDDPDDF